MLSQIENIHHNFKWNPFTQSIFINMMLNLWLTLIIIFFSPLFYKLLSRCTWHRSIITLWHHQNGARYKNQYQGSFLYIKEREKKKNIKLNLHMIFSACIAWNRFSTNIKLFHSHPPISWFQFTRNGRKMKSSALILSIMLRIYFDKKLFTFFFSFFLAC